MHVGIIGRTGLLLRAAEELIRHGHTIAFVQTCRAEAHYDVTEDDFAALAARLGAPFFCGPRIEAPAPEADVAISVNWPTLIGPEIRDAFRHGVLNAHAGDLPRYRGNACPNWAILNFEDRVGLTIHRMTDELDSGPHLAKAFLAIDESTYVGEIYDWLERVTPALFAEAIGRIDGPGFIDPDPAIRPSRMFPRRPEDGRIDWRAGTRDVLALIRASSTPFPGAFSELEGTERIHILRARPFVPDYDFRAVPGQVCLRHAGNPVIATGDGMIEIEDCRTDGHADARALVGRSLRHRLL